MMNNYKSWWWNKSFLYVGRMSLDKGVVNIIQVWLDLYDKHKELCPSLWLVGGLPEEIDDIRQYIGLEKIEYVEQIGKIHWWGYQDYHGISALLTRSLVLVTHSLYEPGGRVIIEAMASGVPAIATPHGFALDLIRNWVNGFLVEHNDNNTLKQRIEHFIRQPLLKNALGEKAKETIKDALNHWKFMDTHFEVYESLSVNVELKIPNLVSNRTNNNYKSVLSNRLINNIYPFNNNRPQSSHIKKFVENNLNLEVNEIVDVNNNYGSSFLWIVNIGKDKYIVKHPYTRFETKPLWHFHTNGTLIRYSKERFDTEVFASQFNGFVPIHSYNSTDKLFLRKLYQRADFDYNMMPRIIACIKNLAESSYKVDRNIYDSIDAIGWNACLTEIQDANSAIKQRLSAIGDKFDFRQTLSLKLKIRTTELLLQQEYPRIYQANKYYLDIIKDFSQVEKKFPMCLTNGGIDDSSLVIENQDIKFIDGEHIHIAREGKDVASMINYLLLDKLRSDKKNYTKINDYLDDFLFSIEKKGVILLWSALMLLDDYIKTMVIKEEKDSCIVYNDFKEIMRLIKQVFI
jgi:hypothetical protein